MIKIRLLLLFSLLFFVCYTNPLKAQDNKLIEFNGWEFLKWKIKLDKAETILSEINNDSLDISSYSENGYRTAFKFQGLRTYLYYDSLKRLIKVEQHKDFSVVEKEKADVFYMKTEEMLVNKYGKPDKKTNNKTKEIITLTWNLKYTKVLLTYDYKYKIIDEFGCCSYQIDLVFSPIK